MILFNGDTLHLTEWDLQNLVSETYSWSEDIHNWDKEDQIDILFKDVMEELENYSEGWSIDEYRDEYGEDEYDTSEVEESVWMSCEKLINKIESEVQ
jgi:hypothetical protein